MKLIFSIIFLPKVHFLVKTPVPDSHDDIITFIQRLASVGVNLEAYRIAYEADNEDRYLLQSNKRQDKLNKFNIINI